MPVIKSAKKKLRQDVMRQKENSLMENIMKQALKDAKKSPTIEKIKKAVKITDKAVKKHIIHKNKAARIKSSLSHLLQPKAPEKTITVSKKSVKKTPAKQKK